MPKLPKKLTAHLLGAETALARAQEMLHDFTLDYKHVYSGDSPVSEWNYVYGYVDACSDIAEDIMFSFGRRLGHWNKTRRAKRK